VKKNILLVTVVAFLYYLSGVISLNLLDGNKIISVGVFIPEGIALAFAIYFGKKIIPGIFIGQFILAYTHFIPFVPALEISFINSIEAMMAIYLFDKFKLSKDIKVFRDILGLFILIIFILQPFSAILSNSMLLWDNQIASDDFYNSIFSWWFGNVMGQLLFTPFLLIIFSNYKNINIVEYILYGIGYSLYLFILEIVFDIQNAFLIMSLSISVIIFIIAKKDIVLGSFLSVIIAMSDHFFIHIGIGAFSSDSLLNNTINFNLYLLAHIIIVWLFGILFEERKRHESELKETIRKEVEKNKEQQLFMLQQNRLAQMGELISMIAHQWRQPLNNLSLINQLIIAKYQKDKLDDNIMEYFKDNSKKQIDLMSNTINDFRNFFKNEDKKQDFSLNEVISNAMEMTEPIFNKHKVSVLFDVTKEYMAFGLSNSLIQVILNIINNAKDALIENDIEDKKVKINIIEDENTIIISIKDNAGGIDEGIIDKVFDPYFSTKHSKNGTGLGLYMSKMILEEQMQWKLKVCNTKDGANFKIIINTKDNNE